MRYLVAVKTIRKYSNSFVVTIPRRALNMVNLHEGDYVLIFLSKNEIIITPAKSPEYENSKFLWFLK